MKFAITCSTLTNLQMALEMYDSVFTCVQTKSINLIFQYFIFVYNDTTFIYINEW